MIEEFCPSYYNICHRWLSLIKNIYINATWDENKSRTVLILLCPLYQVNLEKNFIERDENILLDVIWNNLNADFLSA